MTIKFSKRHYKYALLPLTSLLVYASENGHCEDFHANYVGYGSIVFEHVVSRLWTDAYCDALCLKLRKMSSLQTSPETGVNRKFTMSSLLTTHKVDVQEPSAQVRPPWQRLRYNHQMHLYTIDEKPIIWTFYDRSPPPAYVRLSLATVYCHNEHNLHIQLVYGHDLHHYLDDIHPVFPQLAPEHKADYFRTNILEKYGGVYIDSDTISMGNMRHLYSLLTDVDIVNIDWAPESSWLSIGVMGPWRANNTLAREWKQAQRTILDTKVDAFTKGYFVYPIKWAEMCGQPLKTIAWRMFADGLNTTDGFRYHMLNGPTTYGQWIRDKRVQPVFLLNEYALNETEMFMYFGSFLHDWDNRNVLEFIQEDFAIVELISRCAEMIVISTSDQKS